MPETFDQVRADAAFANSEPCIGIVSVETEAQDGEVLGLEALYSCNMCHLSERHPIIGTQGEIDNRIDESVRSDAAWGCLNINSSGEPINPADIPSPLLPTVTFS